MVILHQPPTFILQGGRFAKEHLYFINIGHNTSFNVPSYSATLMYTNLILISWTIQFPSNYRMDLTRINLTLINLFPISLGASSSASSIGRLVLPHEPAAAPVHLSPRPEEHRCTIGKQLRAWATRRRSLRGSRGRPGPGPRRACCAGSIPAHYT